MKHEIKLLPSYWASVSGGKDSFYMLKMILNSKKYILNGVVHFELEIDYPFIKNVIKYMEHECKKYNIPFIKIKPRKSWEELYNKYGYPSRLRRWCNSSYKLDCKKQFNNYMKKYGYNVNYYIGYCIDEEKRYKDRKLNEIYPLVENGIVEENILEWAKQQDIYNDYYKYNDRCGCMGCPMSTLKEGVYLKRYYPKEFNYFYKKMIETEKKVSKEKGQKFSIWGNSKYDTEYRIKRINNIINYDQVDIFRYLNNLDKEG